MGRVKKARGTPLQVMHTEAETESCICERLESCGGIVWIELDCPEHGGRVELTRYHTHAVQVDRIAVGTAHR